MQVICAVLNITKCLKSHTRCAIEIRFCACCSIYSIYSNIGLNGRTPKVMGTFIYLFSFIVFVLKCGTAGGVKDFARL